MKPYLSRYTPSTIPHARKPVRGSLIWWLRFLGVVAFFIILLQLPKNQDVHLARIDLRWLGLCMLLAILQLLLDAFVWHWLLVMQRIRHPYPKTLVAYLASQYLGLVTPGHVGEYLAAGYISMETGITFGYALSSVVVKRILAWVVVAGFGVWGLDLFARLPRLEGMQWMVLTTLVVLLILAAAITIWMVSLRRLAKKWKKLSPWQIDMTEFWAGMHSLLSLRLIFPLAMAALAFALLFVQLDAVLHALGITLPLGQVSKIVAFSRVVGRLIPLSVVGFGSKDAATIEMLAQHGIDPTVGLTVTLVLLLCSYLVTLLLSGLCWWIKPLVIRRAGRSSS
ncbi:MAG: flippase-like domain-containing protein [Candidatus Omnitrophica bacterium]|nr:flippase-like domain-containing protein [Candidatus Omnitrophota bacterium]